MPARGGGNTCARGRGSGLVHKPCGDLAALERLRTGVRPGLSSGLLTTLAHSTLHPTPHKGQDWNPTRGDNGPTRAPQGHTRGSGEPIDRAALQKAVQRPCGRSGLGLCRWGSTRGHTGPLCGALAALWRSSRTRACVGLCVGLCGACGPNAEKPPRR